jgi:anti-anti-sigma regulatory factor
MTSRSIRPPTGRPITADMTAVTYCDSAAIRALFVAAGKARLTIQVATVVTLD